MTTQQMFDCDAGVSFERESSYRVSFTESAEKLLSDGDLEVEGATGAYRPKSWSLRRQYLNSRTTLWLTLLNVFTLGLTICLSGRASRSTKPHPASPIKASSYYSPIIEDIPDKMYDVKLNGTLWPEPNPSWSRIEPGPEATKLWDWYEPIQMFPLTREDVVNLGKDPKTAARFPEDHWGLGPDKYMGSLDVFHKIHCLNELRKMTFLDYANEDFAKPKRRHTELWWIHKRHCVDMLAQDLQCHADADILTYNWVDTQQHPFPDFSINRRCRSWDDTLDWLKEHKVDMSLWYTMVKPKDQVQIPGELGYYKMFGFEGSDLYPDGKGYPGEL